MQGAHDLSEVSEKDCEIKKCLSERGTLKRQKHHTRRLYQMNKKLRSILEVLFVLLFILTGCSVDSFFEGGALEWSIAFLVLLAVAMVIGGNSEDR